MGSCVAAWPAVTRTQGPLEDARTRPEFPMWALGRLDSDKNSSRWQPQNEVTVGIRTQ